MSRKGKQLIELPKGVEVHLSDKEVSVKGPKGQLKQSLPPEIKVEKNDNQLTISVDEKAEEKDAKHGLYRALVNNIVCGVSQGFEKRLEMIGVGYRAAVKGKSIDLEVGLSHPASLEIPEGVDVKVEKNTQIIISGIDKQRIGQFAADIRAKRPPEPYKGKGIRYVGEYVRRKAGKATGK